MHCELCLRDECICTTDEWLLQEALRPPPLPPPRPWRTSVALDGTRKVWEPEKESAA
jgi:hypothetical protein